MYINCKTCTALKQKPAKRGRTPEPTQKENAASAARLHKRAVEMGNRVVLEAATITRTKTGVVVESRNGGRPSNPQPTRNFFTLADNPMYTSIDQMFVSFVDHFTSEEGR